MNIKVGASLMDRVVAEMRSECRRLASMPNTEFVQEVRRLENEHPAWMDVMPWFDFVNREINMRLLLK